MNCNNCRYMHMTGRVNLTKNCRSAGPRGECFCEHPRAREAFEKMIPRSHRMATFIGFTAPGGNVPQLKTSPKWCPLKERES